MIGLPNVGFKLRSLWRLYCWLKGHMEIRSPYSMQVGPFTEDQGVDWVTCRRCTLDWLDYNAPREER